MKKKSNPLDSPQWLSQSTTNEMALAQQGKPSPSASRSGSPSYSQSGSGEPKGIGIEFTKPKPPGTLICCGKEIKGKAAASGPGAKDAAVTVVGPDGKICGQGKGGCTFTYTPKEAECGKKLTFTASAPGYGEASGTVTVVKITISEIERVPIHAGKPANVRKCTISILPNNVPLVAKIERIAGEGQSGLARFLEGGTSKTVMGTVEVSIAGVQNSDKKSNMRLYVPVDGDDCAVRKFSVRTWPSQGVFMPNVVKPQPGVLWFHFQWISETGDVADLTPKIWVGEVVNYNPALPIPPYGAPAPPNPTMIAEWPGTQSLPVAPKLGSGTDKQLRPNFQAPSSPNVNTAQQFMGFWDEVLDGVPVAGNIHVLQGPIPIKRTIAQDGAGNWTYTVEKLGTTSDPYQIPQ
jgi:hypothetical protein